VLLLGRLVQIALPGSREEVWERKCEHFTFSVVHPVLLVGFGVFLPIVIFAAGKELPPFVLLSAMMMLPFIASSLILQWKRTRPGIFDIAKLILVSFILSSLFSFIILTASTCVSFPAAYVTPESPWFQTTADGVSLCKSSYWLLLLNYPFDFLTILVTFLLLSRITRTGSDSEPMVRRRPWVIFPVTIVSVISSALLTAGLFTAIKVAEGSVPLNQVLDIHLLPLLLTTFVPVTILMCAFIILFLTHYALMPAITRLFHVLGEKRNQSPFGKLAFLLGAWLSILKVLTDWIVTKR
jgi:hypothetical protein